MKSASQEGRAGPNVIPRPEHNVSRSNVSRNALKVLYRLKDAGFQAFLVGGSVRDLLLGHLPKDFDVATDAHPEEVRELFRNCRLIGRRFRLAHVRFGREIIEVATFRATAVDAAEEGERVHDEEHGLILRDNVYGSIDEDVWRRDFTANALYYNIADFSIWDYVGGVEDVRSRRLRLIGDPETRYREDPVRMLRAVRFAAKLEFGFDPGTAEPIPRLSALLAHVAPARLFDEILKLFHGGFAVRCFELLEQFGLFAELFPGTATELAHDEEGSFRSLIRRALLNTDERIAEDRPVTPMFLFAVLLWAPIRARAEDLAREQERLSEYQALMRAADEIVEAQLLRVALPRRFSVPMREMITLQPRFEQQRGRRALRLLEHKRFRAAYDFLLLRAEVGDADPALAEWWTRLQTLSPEDRETEVGLRKAGGGGKRRRRRRRKPRNGGGGGDASSATSG